MSSLTSRRATRWLVVLLCLLSSTPLFAQSTGGRILGRVADPTGAVLANVKITLVNEATAVGSDTQTNSSGDYSFLEVKPGIYDVNFDHSGFKKNIRKGVTVEVNQVVTLNLTMQPGGAKEIVEVTSEAPLVDTTSTQLGAVVNDRSVSQLPLNQRDTYQFLQLQPGVVSPFAAGTGGNIVYGSDQTGAVSVNGGRGRSNNFSVNGGDANDQFVNLPAVQPTPDSIEEFRVLTNTFATSSKLLVHLSIKTRLAARWAARFRRTAPSSSSLMKRGESVGRQSRASCQCRRQRNGRATFRKEERPLYLAGL